MKTKIICWVVLIEKAANHAESLLQSEAPKTGSQSFRGFWVIAQDSKSSLCKHELHKPSQHLSVALINRIHLVFVFIASSIWTTNWATGYIKTLGSVPITRPATCSLLSWKITFPLKDTCSQNKSISNWTINSEGFKDNFYSKVSILEILKIFFFFFF